MYQALYRKYRPRTFSDVAGQEHITETLRKQVMLERLSHAYLFVGTRGTGKTTCAKVLARAVNCRHPVDGNPCNECDACVGIENGAILDVLEIDAASNNGVDNVRALREEANYIPASVAKRVYIVDEVHMLSTSAFNALLKTLEEPPEHLIYILATTELHKVPATILSRCQRFTFKRIPQQVIVDRLNSIAVKEDITLTADAAEALAALADGSLRDAISLLDQCASGAVVDLKSVQDTVGLVMSHEIQRLTAAIAHRETAAALSIFDDLYKDGRDMMSLLNELASIMRDMLVCRLSPESGLLSGAFGGDTISVLSGAFAHERIFFCLDAIREALISLTRGGNARLPAELCIIRLCNEQMAEDSAAILARLKDLEEITSGSRLAPVSLQHSTAAGDVPDKQNIPEKSSAPMTPERAPEPAPPRQEEQAPAEPAEDAQSEQEPERALPDQEEQPDDRQQAGAMKSVRDQWSEILELIRSTDSSTHATLADSNNVTAGISDGILTIYTDNVFVTGSVKSESVSKTIKDAACVVLGHEVAIRTASCDSMPDKSIAEKQEELISFINMNL